jgi:hypothetical protein
MIELTKRETLLPGDWTVQCGEAFAAIKMFLTNAAPVLTIPNPLTSPDASVNGIGALLMQDGKVHTTAKRFTPAETTMRHGAGAAWHLARLAVLPMLIW